MAGLPVVGFSLATRVRCPGLRCWGCRVWGLEVLDLKVGGAGACEAGLAWRACRWFPSNKGAVSWPRASGHLRSGMIPAWLHTARHM